MQSAGSESTAMCRRSRREARIGRAVVTWWLQAECSADGATIVETAPAGRAASKAASPGAAMPSSFVSRNRGGSGESIKEPF